MNPVSYRFNNGVPNQITHDDRPVHGETNMDNDLGIFAQDRWTLNRMTLNLALRFDSFQTSFPEQTVGPAPLVPNRNITFPEQDNLDWKDITYRTGFVYDVCGNGKTAIKVALNKYLLGQTLNGIGRNPNPVSWRSRSRQPVVDRCQRRLRSAVRPAESAGANGELRADLRTRLRHEPVRATLYDTDLTDRLGPPSGELGVLGRRAARAPARASRSTSATSAASGRTSR